MQCGVAETAWEVKILFNDLLVFYKKGRLVKFIGRVGRFGQTADGKRKTRDDGDGDGDAIAGRRPVEVGEDGKKKWCEH